MTCSQMEPPWFSTILSIQSCSMLLHWCQHIRKELLVLQVLGFSSSDAMGALRSAQGDVDRAAELLLLSGAAPELTLEAKVFGGLGWMSGGFSGCSMDFCWNFSMFLGCFLGFRDFLVVLGFVCGFSCFDHVFH